MAFGSFDKICGQSPFPICSLVGNPTNLTSQHQPLIMPTCSARSIEVANTIIFQAATDFTHIGALAMTAIMIFHVRSKFTAVGRKEILTFFYLFMALTAVSLVLDAGVMGATNSGPFPWFVAAQNGLASALCTSLLINAFVGFQLYEDGTRLSVWLLRLTCLGMFVISFAVSLLTFKGWAGLGPTNTTGLFVVLFVINALFVAVYVVMQVILVVNTLQDRWPLGDLAFGTFFFVVGQVIVYQFGTAICEGTSHYLDGLFLATICNLLAVMMVYKYWDSITKEDLEFSVGTKQGNWEVKEPFLVSEPSEEHLYARASFYERPNRSSTYDSLSLDYRPQSQHDRYQQNYPTARDRLSHGPASYVGGGLPDARNSYGDVRKSVNIRSSSIGNASYHDDVGNVSDREYAASRGRKSRNSAHHTREMSSGREKHSY